MNDYPHDDIENVTALFDYLTGEAIPEGYHVTSPKLSEKMAETVIWFLQEGPGRWIPDNLERCQECGNFYASDYEGFFINCGNNDGTGLANEYDRRMAQRAIFSYVPKTLMGPFCDDICLARAAWREWQKEKALKRYNKEWGGAVLWPVWEGE